MIRVMWSADIYNMNMETLARAASEIGEMFIAICNVNWQLKHLQGYYTLNRNRYRRVCY